MFPFEIVIWIGYRFLHMRNYVYIYTDISWYIPIISHHCKSPNARILVLSGLLTLLASPCRLSATSRPAGRGRGRRWDSSPGWSFGGVIKQNCDRKQLETMVLIGYDRFLPLEMHKFYGIPVNRGSIILASSASSRRQPQAWLVRSQTQDPMIRWFHLFQWERRGLNFQ